MKSDLQRRPWVLGREAVETLRTALGFPSADALAAALPSPLSRAAGAPVAVGIAKGSGALYVGPALELGCGRRLTAMQALVANAFAHAEGCGFAAISASEPPCKRSGDILRELASWQQVRWLDPSPADDLRGSSAGDGFGIGLRGAREHLLLDVLGDGGG